MSTTIFHIDVNSAFLSWSALEQLHNGSDVDLREIPSVIGGSKESRHGIVLAKSIPAKAYGIQTAEPIGSAERKCPVLTVVPPNHALYQKYSNRLMDLLHTYTCDIEQLSIDECYLDYGPIAHIYGSPLEGARHISCAIKDTLGFTVNIGIAPNKLLAKMASDFRKPDAIHTLYPEEIPTKMWILPIEDLYMVGRASSARLRSLGIHTIGDLAQADVEWLKREFKSHGQMMHDYANGIASDKLCTEPEKLKGIGNSTTLAQDVTTAEEAHHILLSLAEQVSTRLRKADSLAQSISVEIKYYTFRQCSHQGPLITPVNTTETLYQEACRLFDSLWDGTPIRLLGIRTSKLIDTDAPLQMNLTDYLTPQSEKQRQLDSALDKIKNKYGKDAITRGTLLSPPVSNEKDMP